MQPLIKSGKSALNVWLVNYINRLGMSFEVWNAVLARVKTKGLSRVYYVLTPEVDNSKTRELVGLPAVHHSHLRSKIVIAGWTTQYPWQFPLWSSKKSARTKATNYMNLIYSRVIYIYSISIFSTYIYDFP